MPMPSRAPHRPYSLVREYAAGNSQQQSYADNQTPRKPYSPQRTNRVCVNRNFTCYSVGLVLKMKGLFSIV